MKFSKKKLLLLLILLCSIIFIFSATRESKIKDFPIPMSAINIQDDKVKAYTYISIIPITEAKGWESLGQNGHEIEFKKGDRTVVIVNYPEDNKYYMFER
ncbi:hypothetical protein [Bacillus sp. PSXD-155]|uniref:hypothetical protein n=1 Tax=Bacillus sp. PSXD-155 TaxID=3404821 RepID=UPI003BB794F2